MNGTTIEVKAEDMATPLLEQLARRLGDDGRGKIAAAAAGEVKAAVQSHLFALGEWRHATAEKLGAHPTDIAGRVAEGVTVRQEGAEAAVVVPHPMFRRAFGDTAIAPRNAKSLAIPVAAASYGKAPRSFANLFVWKSKKGNKFLARRKGKEKGLQLLYLLWRDRIVQRQDRSLLPDDAQLAAAGRKGASALLEDILARRAAARSAANPASAAQE